MKLISVVTPCYNEEENVEDLYRQVKEIFGSLPNYTYEHIFIDNASTDNTVGLLRTIAKKERNLKIIVNARNYGHIRSPYYGLLQAKGDAAILIAADFQDPPYLIKEFLKKWEEGYKIAIGVRSRSEESSILSVFRKSYYNLIGRLSEIGLIKNFTGFGLYDQEVIKILREIGDPYPYFRGLICDIGFQRAQIAYSQPKRKRGISKNNFYTLYDMAMLGITSHSKIPLRLATMIGFFLSLLCLMVALGYFIFKLVFWRSFSIGPTPLVSVVVGLFFFASVQLFFLGVIGEYVGTIHTQILKRPLVVEKERINF